MSELILHCGGAHVTRDELRAVTTPEPTPTWRPVPHHQVAELVTREAAARGYEIMAEDYGLNDSGSKLFGVLRFHPQGRPDMSRALGFRNSHDKSLALGLTVGCRVAVCDNLMFGGETTIHRKHTSGIEIEELIPHAFDKLDYQYVRLEETIEGLKLKMVTIDEARVVTVMAAEMGAVPSCDIIPVLDEFREPQHKEFRDPTMWSLHNAFTETTKKYTPMRADQCHRSLAKLFGLT